MAENDQDKAVASTASSDTRLIVQAIDEMRKSFDRNARESARLAQAMEQALRVLAARTSADKGGLTGSSAKLSINWVIGPPDNIGWAYGNNAKRLAAQLPKFEHGISIAEPSDVAVYFDAIVADRFPVEAKRSILRIGGPRPLDRLYGDDEALLAKGLERFDAIIALNAQLYFRALRVHRNVHLLPNALDLKAWSPSLREDRSGQSFTVGFAASLRSSTEAHTKGHDIIKSAVDRVGARLLTTSKGEGVQIEHDRMIRDFYNRIDVLVHPARPGREGSSNVIMEALALGVPVLTTEASGFHGEFLMDGRSALIRHPEEQAFVEAIALLQRDDRLRRRIGSGGRAFAERHHDLRRIAKAYGDIFGQALYGHKRIVTPKRRKISFVPFWTPSENFGSSRLRALYPSKFLANSGEFQVQLGYAEDADVVIIVQMASDKTLAAIHARPDQFVVYDVCDKYYENPRLFKHVDPPIDSLERFKQLCARADLIITPTRELKIEVASRQQDDAVRFIPEPVDYGAHARPIRDWTLKKVLWFGNPDRGNFESARWMLERLRDEHGFEPVIVSRLGYFKTNAPEYLSYVRPWSVETMTQAFAECSLCVVAYDQSEQAKSPNRFVAAIMQGLPTLACASPSVRDLMVETNHTFALTETPGQLDKAVTRLESAEFRDLFVRRVQRHLLAKYGEEATAAAYSDLLRRFTFDASTFVPNPRRVAFVTHNLSLAEGAPRSLLELVAGLREQGIEPFVYSPPGGPLAQAYVDLGISLTVFDPNGRHSVKLLNTRLDAIEQHFGDFLKDHGIEAVICNTVKTAPLVEFAHRRNVPALLIVRESYEPHDRFSHFLGEGRLAAIQGATHAKHVAFVATTSREAWNDQPFAAPVHVIPNGISPDRFAAVLDRSQVDCRADLGLPVDAVIAVCVGSINQRKGQREIVDAFGALPMDVRDRAFIVFVGAVESGQLNEFERALESLSDDVTARLRVVEATTDIAPWYRAADLFLMNSSSEAYPRSVVEALYFGLPIISTRVFGVAEQVKHGSSGFLYAFNDMAAWSNHFSLLVIDADQRRRMSEAAARAFWELTGYREMLLAYKGLIADMINKKRVR